MRPGAGTGRSTMRNVSPRSNVYASASQQPRHASRDWGDGRSSPKGNRSNVATGLIVCVFVMFIFLLLQASRSMPPEKKLPRKSNEVKTLPQDLRPAEATGGALESARKAEPRHSVQEIHYKNTSSPCAIASPNALMLSDDGARCLFPFHHKGEWITDCARGFCATAVNPLGHATALANCSVVNPIAADYKCVGVENVRSCSSDVNASEIVAGCGTPIERGTCICKSSVGTIRHSINCVKMTCDSVCSNALEDVMSASHSLHRSLDPDTTFLSKLGQLARKHVATKKELTTWRDYVKDLPVDSKDVPAQWCGKGIVIMAGSVGTLPQALASVFFIRDHLASSLPVEIWQSADEVTTYSTAMKGALQRLGVIVRALPEDAFPSNVNEMFSLKPAVILASSFDEVLFFDADAMPLVDPLEIFQIRPNDTSAVFWPDLWTLLNDAKIWDAVGGWPFPDPKTAASQESGIMVVCKSCGAWRPLALAFYFNFHESVYYPAMYFGHFRERGCRKCGRGHSVPGIGDKDTFQIAWIALKEGFKMMPPASLGGTLLPQRELVCGTSFLHRSNEDRFIALHHNSNKWWWKDFESGRWASHHNGLLLTHYSSYEVNEAAFRADGVNQWRSVTYSTRADAGSQKPPPGARWCIVYKGQIRNGKIDDHAGWPVEQTLLKYFSKMYINPWLVEWMVLNSQETKIQKCIKHHGWLPAKDVSNSEDDHLRNTVISELHERGKGSVSILQGKSDRSLAELCMKLDPSVAKGTKEEDSQSKEGSKSN